LILKSQNLGAHASGVLNREALRRSAYREVPDQAPGFGLYF
jgi:hypothetical protein